MNLENIDIVKISESNYKIYQLDKSIGKRSNLDLEFDGISSPFGLEEFYHVYYINWEIDSLTLQILSNLELEFKDIVLESNSKYNSWSWISNIKERKGFSPLLKTRIPQCRGKFQVETTDSKSLYELDYKSKLKIKVTLDSIWFNEKNKTFGLLWFSKTIY